jgi:hypothetical protein
MQIQLLIFILAPVALCFESTPRLFHTGNQLLARQTNICDAGEVTCDDSCMPTGSVCCRDGSSTYCHSGERCITGACCPIGKSCDTNVGTMTILDSGPTTKPSSSSPTSGSSGSGSSNSGSNSGSSNSGSSNSGSSNSGSSSGFRSGSLFGISFVGGLMLVVGYYFF